MATYSYEETPKQYMWRQYLDETFVDIYVIEIVLKLIGYGPRTFVQDRFNIFDAFIVAIGLIDHILIRWIGLDFERVTALQFFKALRAIRILKLARFNKGIRKVLAQTVKSLGVNLVMLCLNSSPGLQCCSWGIQVVLKSYSFDY